MNTHTRILVSSRIQKTVFSVSFPATYAWIPVVVHWLLLVNVTIPGPAMCHQTMPVLSPTCA